MGSHATAPGVYDILPNNPNEEWKNSHLWIYVEGVIRELVKLYGFSEIRTPVFERTELFQRGVGETTDIVSKEMYTFMDKGNRSLSLRPEGTAPAMRAFLEHKLHMQASVHKLYYIQPMFRYERAQAGRYRQHHQFGAEVIGVAAPEQDAEMIDLLYTLYNRLQIKDLKVNINSIGDIASRLEFRKVLEGYLKERYHELSDDSKQRLETNLMRILDSKDPKDQHIVAGAPSILEYLNEASREHFESLQRLLQQLKIPFEINPLLVRGLDYYNHTVFEITSGKLGAQNSLSGGGRYDGLIKTLGGPDLPAIGFGVGLERTLQTMINQHIPLPERPQVRLYLIPLGSEAKQSCFAILHALRQNGIAAEMEFSGKKLGKAMQYANHIGARYVAVVGDTEIQNQAVALKDMSSGNSVQVDFQQLEKHLR